MIRLNYSFILTEVKFLQINLENWAEAAKIYAEVKGDNKYSCFCRDFAERHFTDVTQLHILDAGCGDGEYTEMFRKKGAIATGCDGSFKVIEIAKKQYPHCKFDVADLSDRLPCDDYKFDLVFSNLVLMDIEEINTAVKEFERVLKKDGKLFFSIVHPAFYLADWEKNEDGIIVHKKVTSYITPRDIEMVWVTQPVLHYHRTISYYFNLLAEHSFTFFKMYEPKVYEDTKIPDIPLYLFAEFIKR